MNTHQRLVSHAVRVSRFSPLWRSVRTATRIIDRVHRDGILPPIRVRRFDFQDEETLAAFQPGMGIGLPSIDVSPKAIDRLDVLIHEIAHFLDQHGFETPNYVHASTHGALCEDWRNAVRATHVYARLAYINALPLTAVTMGDGEIVFLRTDENAVASSGVAYPAFYEMNAAKYAFEIPELFARSYLQYIVVESGDVALREQFMRLRTEERLILHWDDEDFVHVHHALDRLLHALKWR